MDPHVHSIVYCPHPFFEASVLLVRKALWVIRLHLFHWVKWSLYHSSSSLIASFVSDITVE